MVAVCVSYWFVLGLATGVRHSLRGEAVPSQQRLLSRQGWNGVLSSGPQTSFFLVPCMPCLSSPTAGACAGQSDGAAAMLPLEKDPRSCHATLLFSLPVDTTSVSDWAWWRGAGMSFSVPCVRSASRQKDSL